MNDILIFIGGTLIGLLLAWVWFKKKEKEIKKDAERTEKEIKTEREIWYGFSKFNEKLAKIKAERKQKIVDELKRVGKMKTNVVADLLDISRATAFRYLEELQKEGVIEQIGKTGKDVEYKIR